MSGSIIKNIFVEIKKENILKIKNFVGVNEGAPSLVQQWNSISKLN